MARRPERDIFICHASGDKESYVYPFAAELETHGITYWLDQAEITWGDRITEKINGGLARSRYVVVFLTDTFLKRHWPQAELGSALNREASTGGVVVLPLMIASSETVFGQYPLLRDKHYLRWEDGIESLVRTLRDMLGLGDGTLRLGEWWSVRGRNQLVARVVDFSLVAEPTRVRFHARAVARVVAEWGPRRGALILLLRGMPRREIQEFLRLSRRAAGRTIARFQKRYGERKRNLGKAMNLEKTIA